MKRKITKIWGVGLTLVLATTMLLFPVPASAGTLSWGSEDLPDELAAVDVLDIAVSADGGVTYATGGIVEPANLGGGATWSTVDPYSGSYSALFTTGHQYVEFVPATGTTIADLAAASAADFGFWYHLSAGWGPQLELKFTSGTEFVDVTFMVQWEAIEGEWTEWDLATPFVNVSTYDGTDDDPYGTSLAAALAQLETDERLDWELTRVRVELWEVIARDCYIDDVTIDGTTYELEDGYASSGNIYRSTNGGESWSTLSNPSGAVAPKLVAVTPDDENYIVVVADGTEVYVSDDAGATWDQLTGGPDLDVINDLAISAAKSGNHFVAVAGEAASAGEVWYYEIGAVGAIWEDATDTELGFDPASFAGAVAFSPNFPSDEVMVAITADASAVLFQLFSFDQKEWNGDAGFTDYPVDITQDTPGEITSLDSASIALSPDYLGGDDAMRLAFVGITVNGGTTAEETSGIQRIEDDDNDVLKDDVHINSVDFDGTNLVAGEFDGTTVYRCADPLGSSPSVKSSAGLKSPGGDTLVVVAFAGEEVVAGTSGDESAFAVSKDDGQTFNDISLIDTTLDTLSNVAVSSDGSNVYLATASGIDDLSLWRYASRWERVLSVKNNTLDISDVIVRIAPDDIDVVYVADAGGTKIYYSADAGQDKWHTRISTETILDLAVETDGGVVYVATAGGYVSKSTNGGFTWASKKSSKLSVISMIVSLGEDLLLAGSTDGKAAYSTDGNSSWTKLADGMTSGVVSVIADGLDEGDLICAGVDDTTGGDHLYRWDWDDEEWDEIGDLDAGYVTTGIALQNGVLYASAVTTTDNSSLYRSLNPTSDDPSWNTIDSDGELFNVAPSALRVSVSDTTVKLWAIDSLGALFSYEDTLAAVAPTLLAPTEGLTNKMNPISGKAFDITFSWVRPSKNVDAYDFQIALDSGFNEVALSQVLVNDSSTVGILAGPAGSTVDDKSFAVEYMPDTTYYWRVRVDEYDGYGPIRSQWSEVRSFKIVEAPVAPPVTVSPTPEITVSVPPAPSITVTPEIIIPTPEIVLPAPQVTLPPSPAPVAPIPGWALYLIIIIGAVLVIALIVLILRTRRPV